MEPANASRNPLNILMASGVPKRREGGVAVIVYNLGREMERRGHQVSYIIRYELMEAGSVSPRFIELVFAHRLSKYISQNKQKFSIANLHAPAGFLYGLRRRWSRAGGYPPYVMTLHGLEEHRVHVMSREVKKGRAWNFSLRNRLWDPLDHPP